MANITLVFLRRRSCVPLLAVMMAAAAPAGASPSLAGSVPGGQVSRSDAPRIEKIEPPNWWTGVTSDLMVLLTGRNLKATEVSCMPLSVVVKRTQLTATGTHLFVWLAIPQTSPAPSAACQIHTATGATSFQLPLPARPSVSGKYQGFSQDDVLYLIMADRFAQGNPANCDASTQAHTCDRGNPRAYHGGDFRGIREHLDYLQQLGVTAIWLTPIVENDPHSPQDYHGYGAVDEYAVEQHFGTLADLQELVAAAHQRAIKVILDFVPNHVGPHHPWASDPPEPDWFHGTIEHHLTATGDFQFLVDPHAPPRFWRAVVDGWFAGVLPDLNQENPEVAQYFTQNAIWWAEQTGIDGYRLDTFPYVSRQFWSDWHRALHQIYPRMTTVGEVFNRDPYITSFFAGGREHDGIDSGVTTVFDYPLFFSLRAAALGGPLAAVVDVLSQDRLYPRPELLVPFLGNHDVPRLASLPGATPANVELAFSILLTMRGIPQLYYGDEIGMTGGADPDNRHDFPGGFPGDTADAFVASGRTPEQQAIFAHLERLLSLRRAHPALREGKLWHLEFGESDAPSHGAPPGAHADAHCYAFARVSQQERLVVALNTDEIAHSIHVALSDTPLDDAQWLDALLEARSEEIHDHAIDMEIPPHQLQIFAVK
jgi:neopullulanase